MVVTDGLLLIKFEILQIKLYFEIKKLIIFKNRNLKKLEKISSAFIKTNLKKQKTKHNPCVNVEERTWHVSWL